MAIAVCCGNCQKKFAAPEYLNGRTAQCPACRAMVPVGAQVQNPQTPPPPPVTRDGLRSPSPQPPAVATSVRPAPLLSTGTGEASKSLLAFSAAEMNAFTRINVMFIVGLSVATFVACLLYLVLYPRTLALYLAGGAVASTFLAAFFLVTLRRQDREQFDGMYQLAASVPGGTFLLIAALYYFGIAWNYSRGSEIPSVDQITYFSVEITVAIIVASIIGAVLLFCFRNYGFWRSYASAQIIGLVFGMAFSPFYASIIEEMRAREVAREQETKRQQEKSGLEIRDDHERIEREAKERQERDLEEAKVRAENQAKEQEERQRRSQESAAASQRQHEEQEDLTHQHKFAEKAESALDFGKNREGRDWIYADCITRDSANLAKYLRFCPALKRPVISLHWIMGIETTPLDEVNVDNPNSRVDDAIGRATALKLTRQDQRDIGNDFTVRAGISGVAVAHALSTKSFEGRFGPWGAPPKFDRDALRGVTLLPPGTTDAMLGAARALGGDILIAANLQVRPTTGRIPDATLVVRMVDAATGKELWRSEKVTTGQIASSQRKGEVNPAVMVAEAAIKFIEENIVLKSIPDLKPENAQKRAAKISNDPAIGKLAALAELRYYEHKGLLSDNEVKQHYSSLIGSHAAALQSPRLKDRQSAVEDLVIKQ